MRAHFLVAFTSLALSGAESTLQLADVSIKSSFAGALNTDAKVGIGLTNEPAAKLDVRGNTYVIHSGDVGAQSGQFSIMDSDSTDFNMRVNFVVDKRGTDRGAFLIQATESTVSNDQDLLMQAHGGRVGIGTFSPGTALHVDSGSTNIAATFQSTDGLGGIKLQDDTGNVELVAHGSTFQVRPAGGATKFSVDNNGDVGVVGKLKASQICDASGVICIPFDIMYATMTNLHYSSWTSVSYDQSVGCFALAASKQPVLSTEYTGGISFGPVDQNCHVTSIGSLPNPVDIPSGQSVVVRVTVLDTPSYYIAAGVVDSVGSSRTMGISDRFYSGCDQAYAGTVHAEGTDPSRWNYRMFNTGSTLDVFEFHVLSGGDIAIYDKTCTGCPQPLCTKAAITLVGKLKAIVTYNIGAGVGARPSPIKVEYSPAALLP